MQKMLVCFLCIAILLSCNSNKDKTATTESTEKAATTAGVLPYTATYSSSWSTDVSDADLKMVLTSYRDWENNNMTGLATSIGDTLSIDFSTGDHVKLPRADIMKIYTTYRDSMSSVSIDMQGWHKMYSTDKKEGYIVTWYKEIDTYKTGKVDSANFHDINMVKDGKIVWYSQYKRPLKKQ